MMRTTAPPIAISIIPESAAGRCEGADGKGGTGAAITIGANTGAASPIAGGCARGAAEAAERSWRRLDGHNQLPKLILGVRFADGIEVVRSQAQAAA
jgi:hypothetical protein